MSKIFLDSVFKFHRIQTLESEAKESIIDKICYDELYNIHLEKLESAIANSILKNTLYKKRGVRAVAHTSASYRSLYHNSKSNSIELSDILQGLQVRVKRNEVEYEGRKISIGHFRFKYLNIIPVQLVILMEIEPGVVIMMIKCLPKLATTLISYFVDDMGCIVENINFDDQFLKNTITETFETSTPESIGDFELCFQNINTINSSLNSIIIDIRQEDYKKFRDQSNEEVPILKSIYLYLKENTAIDFNALSLTRIRCQLYLITSDGKTKFTGFMSHLPDPDEHGDYRPTIWNILTNICDMKF